MSKRPSSLSMTRWRVSSRGSVAHIRIGSQPTSVCGEVFTKTAKMVASGGHNNPPCLRCNEALKAARAAARTGR